MLSKGKVFLIDDDPIANFCNKDVLQEIESIEQIEEFLEAKKALIELEKLLKEGMSLPHYIFLDIRMPEMDGFEFIEELEYLLEDNEPGELPTIILLTSSRHKRDLELFAKCQLPGYYLNKPLELEELKQKLAF